MKQVQERISTVEDGDGTVNERLSTGGEGPEGQPDTVTERLSGDQHVAVGEPPAPSATKGAWVDYAVNERGAERDAAEALTKAELVETYG